jgi:hypothetical protein
MKKNQIKDNLYGICECYRQFPLFAETQKRLSNFEYPISRFVGQLDGPDSWSYVRILSIFGAQPIPCGPTRRLVAGLIPSYELFLRATGSQIEIDGICDTSLLVHDLIGHLLLDQPITSRGEILACAGVAGFSWSSGADYFINSILMLSFGLPLIENVTPDNVVIDDDIATAIHNSWIRGKVLWSVSGLKDSKPNGLAYTILEQWNYISTLQPFIKDVYT